MLPVSLACPFFVAPSVFYNVYLSCVLCVQCYQFLWLVHSSLPLQFSLTFICPVSCVSNVVSFTGLSFFVAPSVFSNVYLSCFLCVQCCQIHWLVYSSFPHQFSLTCICPGSCVFNVASFSGLSILRCPFSFL